MKENGGFALHPTAVIPPNTTTATGDAYPKTLRVKVDLFFWNIPSIFTGHKTKDMIKAVFETSDELEIKRIAKVNDMTDFIKHLVFQGLPGLDLSTCDEHEIAQKVGDLLEFYGIDIMDLIE